MQNRTLPAAIVSLVAGLIIGFFGGTAYQSRQIPSAPPSAAAQAGQTSFLPENHPSKETIDQIVRLRDRTEKDPNDKEARVQLGNIFYDLAQYEQAIKWYAAALELDPKDVNVRTDMGTAYHFMGNHDRALQEFGVSLSIDPNHPQTLQNIGWVKYTQKDYKGALEAWNTLLRKHPDFQNAAQIRKQIEQVKSEMEGKKS